MFCLNQSFFLRLFLFNLPLNQRRDMFDQRSRLNSFLFDFAVPARGAIGKWSGGLSLHLWFRHSHYPIRYAVRLLFIRIVG